MVTSPNEWTILEWDPSLFQNKKKNVYLISKYKIIQHTCTTSSLTVEQTSTQREVRWNPAILINWKKSGSIIWLHCFRSRPCSFLQLTQWKKNPSLLENVDSNTNYILNLNVLTTEQRKKKHHYWKKLLLKHCKFKIHCIWMFLQLTIIKSFLLLKKLWNILFSSKILQLFAADNRKQKL